MTMSPSFAALLSLATGLALVQLCWPTPRPLTADLALKFSLAIGVGFGISSVLYFLCLFPQTSAGRLALLDVLALGSLVAFLCISFARVKKPPSADPPGKHPPAPILDWKIRWASFLGFVIALVIAICASAALFLRSPHGAWDAFAIWNLRARLLFRGGAQWRDAFSGFIPWSHTDYPLLVPASVARLWTYSGHDLAIWPALLAVIFTYATVGLTVSAVATLRTKSQGFLAGMVLVSAPFFIEHGASEYADVPLSFFVLATLVLLCMQEQRAPASWRLLVLAGITAGFAGWTKNEGMLFLTSILIAHAVVAALLRGGRVYILQAIPFVAGLLPILFVILFFKLHLAGPSDIFSSPRAAALQLLDPHRYLAVATALRKRVFDFGRWRFTLVPILAVYLVALGIDIPRAQKVSLWTAFLALFITLAGDCFVYVIGPNDIQWWLEHSLDRLLLQLWPSAVFLFFLIVRTPERALFVAARSPE
jgi:hypothetical protein